MESEKGQPGAASFQDGRFQVAEQLGFDIVFDFSEVGFQFGGVVVPQIQVVHVSNVGLSSEFFFDKMVQPRQKMIGKILARQIADGQPAPGRGFVTVDDFEKNLE